MHMNILFSLAVRIFSNRLPCSAISHVIPSVDDLNKYAIPAIRVTQPLYGAALIKISCEFLFIYFLPIVNSSVLLTSYFLIFLFVVVFVFSHTSIQHSLS